MANKKSATDSDTTMKVVLVVALIVTFIGGYLVARAKYKPQIIELTKMVAEKDAAMQEMKNSANKIVMREGKMWIYENGIVREMDVDVVLSNGDKVSVDGKVIKVDGSETQLQDGNAVDMDGNMLLMEGSEEATDEPVSY